MNSIKAFLQPPVMENVEEVIISISDLLQSRKADRQN